MDDDDDELTRLPTQECPLNCHFGEHFHTATGQ